MCFPVTCPSCKKTTWDGCGMHVDDVMSTVPTAQQCVCDSNPVSTADSQSTSATSGRA